MSLLVPEIVKSVVWHLGARPSARRTKGGLSYEGAELSVSEHPDAWVQIAQLGGAARWQGRKRQGRFLDALRAQAQVLSWAHDAGVIQPRTAWRVTYFDQETEEERSMLFDSADEAELNAKEFEGTARKVRSWAFGSVGERYVIKQMKVAEVPHDLAADLAPIFFARHLKLDGVWWNETLDPERLSAPRGCILSEQIASWAWTKV